MIKRITESDWRDIPLNLTGIHIAAKPYLYPKTDVIPPPISDEVYVHYLNIVYNRGAFIDLKNHWGR